MLNRGVTPVICEKGSVGAVETLPRWPSSRSLMGEGESFYEGERCPRASRWRAPTSRSLGLQAARPGHINGANVLTAMSALLLYDADRWLRQAEIACAMSLEALLANLKPYDTLLMSCAAFPGRYAALPRSGACMEGGDLATGKIKTKVQDAYSMRSSPR